MEIMPFGVIQAIQFIIYLKRWLRGDLSTVRKYLRVKRFLMLHKSGIQKWQEEIPRLEAEVTWNEARNQAGFCLCVVGWFS